MHLSFFNFSRSTSPFDQLNFWLHTSTSPFKDRKDCNEKKLKENTFFFSGQIYVFLQIYISLQTHIFSQNKYMFFSGQYIFSSRYLSRRINICILFPGQIIQSVIANAFPFLEIYLKKIAKMKFHNYISTSCVQFICGSDRWAVRVTNELIWRHIYYLFHSGPNFSLNIATLPELNNHTKIPMILQSNSKIVKDIICNFWQKFIFLDFSI